MTDRAVSDLQTAADVLRRQNEPACHRVADRLEAALDGDHAAALLGIEPGRGRRLPRTWLSLHVEQRLVRSAAARFFPNHRPNAQAAELHRRFARYESTAWLRDQHAPDQPARLQDTVEAAAWQLLASRGAVPSRRTLRRWLAI